MDLFEQACRMKSNLPVVLCVITAFVTELRFEKSVALKIAWENNDIAILKIFLSKTSPVTKHKLFEQLVVTNMELLIFVISWEICSLWRKGIDSEQPKLFSFGQHKSLLKVWFSKSQISVSEMAFLAKTQFLILLSKKLNFFKRLFCCSRSSELINSYFILFSYLGIWLSFEFWPQVLADIKIPYSVAH